MNAEVIYKGSNGKATYEMYMHLSEMGPWGEITAALFRAAKNSFRAKVYRGHDPDTGKTYTELAYERKQQSIYWLTRRLMEHAEGLKITWGWQIDKQIKMWVLYVDLPGVGQVSFHNNRRLDGPDYPGKWDGVRGEQSERVIQFTQSVLDEEVK